MKEIEPLVVKIKDQKNKKWEEKKYVLVKKIEKKEESHTVKVVVSKVDKIAEDSALQISENKGTSHDLQLYTTIEMFTMLSQMTIKVPLS